MTFTKVPATGIHSMGFAVRDTAWTAHKAVFSKRGQVGLFRVDEHGVIDSGWVETPNGRIDVRCWMDFQTALLTVPR